ncbi:hypothetical protein [Streptomyces mesophilus]|uniref:hypothetical protein n=1 Tax=Streptomyces mesophilus TaxID=1775132 RepID=UPI003327DA04
MPRIGLPTATGEIEGPWGLAEATGGAGLAGRRDAVITCARYFTGHRERQLLARADTVVVPPPHARGSALLDGAPLPAALAAALDRVRPGTRMVSICRVSHVSAAAGLLDGRPAATHWRRAMAFQRAFPQVRVDQDVLFADDGNVLSPAGIAAGVDPCLRLVRDDHGAAVANLVARRCVVPPWRDGGQASFIEPPVPKPTSATTAATRAWALEHPQQPLTLGEQLALPGAFRGTDVLACYPACAGATHAGLLQAALASTGSR